MKPNVTSLEGSPFFKDFSVLDTEKAIDCLALSIKKLANNEQMSLSDFPYQIAIILAGRLSVEKLGAEGDQVILTMLGADDVIWADKMALSEEYYIQVHEPISLLVFEQPIFPKTCHLRATIYEHLLEAHLEQKMKLFEKIELLSFRKLRDRMMYFLSKQEEQPGHCINIHYSRNQLANYLSVDRSALSRELSAMQRDGLITYNRNAFIIHHQH
ncbi:cAMP-binding domain of CRP or a regulatory subunit of cAMP-dependent protein kinases [Amphibacillus marinus]|uniref:cAMP-binding domain of CRP or a regulatory subunit of cAMP-dependent protein kinases n=1 Tax=Amphibacillus marinus TaxID=872970 RepID=A0A1H8LLZ0_9BACI|nr:Crp/Fnr family transcriptional regulator [Amphibacillus marinus]SEO06099.1 cAMP-binding domain of CRP or a regulatory subunit of cAMP-dependent protein kinases [Amphibacillus marinus]